MQKIIYTFSYKLIIQRARKTCNRRPCDNHDKTQISAARHRFNGIFTVFPHYEYRLPCIFIGQDRRGGHGALPAHLLRVSALPFTPFHFRKFPKCLAVARSMVTAPAATAAAQCARGDAVLFVLPDGELYHCGFAAVLFGFCRRAYFGQRRRGAVSAHFGAWAAVYVAVHVHEGIFFSCGRIAFHLME